MKTGILSIAVLLALSGIAQASIISVTLNGTIIFPLFADWHPHGCAAAERPIESNRCVGRGAPPPAAVLRRSMTVQWPAGAIRPAGARVDRAGEAPRLQP